MTIECWQENYEYWIRLTGHAGVSSDGEPNFICSAVSALTYTLIRQLIIMQENSLIELEVTDVYDYMTIKATSNRFSDNDVRLLYETIVGGYELIADEYPANVELIG